MWVVLCCLACAVPARPLEVRPHLAELDPKGQAAVVRPDVVLAVGPFRDARSVLSRTAQKPPFGLAWTGLRRQGENSTGADSFVGDLAEGARGDAIRTLRWLQVFGEVRPVESLELPPGVDLLLLGEVEELVGFQYQATQLVLLPVGLRSRFDPPIGTARVLFRLIGPRGEVWRERIETRVQTPGLTMEQVALDALSAAHERLALMLHRRLAGAPEQNVRIVPVRVLDACGLGVDRARRFVSDASEIFERELGIRLVTEVETWVAPATGGVAEVLAAAERESPPPEGIVLALAPSDRARGLAFGPARSGLARPLGEHAAVICEALEPRVVTIAHEIAHLFGAIHARERGSVMHEVADFEARFFDAANRRILRVSRTRRFGAELAQPTVAALRQVYTDLSGRSGTLDSDQVAEVLRALR